MLGFVSVSWKEQPSNRSGAVRKGRGTKNCADSTRLWLLQTIEPGAEGGFGDAVVGGVGGDEGAGGLPVDGGSQAGGFLQLKHRATQRPTDDEVSPLLRDRQGGQRGSRDDGQKGRVAGRAAEKVARCYSHGLALIRADGWETETLIGRARNRRPVGLPLEEIGRGAAHLGVEPRHLAL